MFHRYHQTERDEPSLLLPVRLGSREGAAPASTYVTVRHTSVVDARTRPAAAVGAALTVRVGTRDDTPARVSPTKEN